MSADIFHPTAENWAKWVWHQALHRFEHEMDEDGTIFKRQTRYPYDDLDPAEVETDGFGNITKMPPARNKPCFGDMITFAMDGNPPKRGKWPPHTKCRKCKVREICKRISEERIAADPDIAAAYASIRPAPHILLKRGTRFLNFVKAVIAHGPYQSVNDEFMAGFQGKMREEQRRRNASARKLKRSSERELGIMSPTLEKHYLNHRDEVRDILLARSPVVCLPPCVTSRHKG